MKNLLAGTAVGIVFLAATSLFSQVQIFEQDLAGIHPYTGVNWNAKMLQPVLGFEYSIEGRTTLGVMASKPLKDTLTIPNLKSFLVNPYIAFEFIEPGNLTLFSFSLRADYVYEDVTKPDTVYDSFTRTSISGGPVFAYRFQTSDRVTIIPEASYGLAYVKWRWNWLAQPDTSKPYEAEGTHLWHDIALGVNLLFRFNEMQGVNFEPKAVFKIRKGEPGSSLVNAEAHFGYFMSF